MSKSEALESWSVRARRAYKTLNVYKVRYSPIERFLHHRTDVHLVWFPKTGGTWARLLLNNALSMHTGVRPADPLDFGEFHRHNPSLPTIRPHNDDEPHWKTPEQLERDKSAYRGKRVILLVRDPRDAVVSLYFQKTKRWKVLEGSLHDFVWQASGSLRTMIAFYGAWAAQRHVPLAISLVRYEDLHRDPRTELCRLLDFAGLRQVRDEVVDAAVEASSFDTMRRREVSLEFGTSRLRPGIRGDHESFKARRGLVGGFSDYLCPEDVERATEVVRRTMNPWYGYS